MAAKHGFISIIDSAPERGARGSCPAGRCNARASLLLLLKLALRRGAEHEISTPCSFAKYLSLQREGPLLGALRGGILNGPQGPQGGDLGLGQALDARDIEPLIGPVTSQRAQGFATLELPDVDGSVIATTGQQLPIGTLPEREDRSLMCCSHPQAFSALYIPPAQYPITPSADQEVPPRSPDGGIDNTGMPCEGLEAFPALHIPHEQFPSVIAAATTGQPCAIGTPDHTRGHSLVPRQPLPQRAIGNPPQVQASIIPTTDHPGAVWAPVYIADDGREGAPVPKEALLCHIPHLDAMLIGSPGEQLPIRTPGHIQW